MTSAQPGSLALHWQVSISGEATAHLAGVRSYIVSRSDILLWLNDGMRLHLTGTHQFDTYIPDFDWTKVAAAFSTGSLRLIGPVLPNEALKLETNDAENTEERLMALVRGQLGIPEKDLSPDVPLITYGLDSLSSSRLSLALNKQFGLQMTQIQLLANISTKDLLLRLGSISDNSGDNGTVETLRRAFRAMEEVLSRYSLDKLPSHSQPPSTSQGTQTKAVILSGATGSLGCHLLAQLIEAVDVHIIYALSRASPLAPQDKQAAALEKEGLSPALSMSPKVVYLACDYDQHMLGLSDLTLSLVCCSVSFLLRYNDSTHFP